MGKMSKYLAFLLVVARVVSGQAYESFPGSTAAAATTSAAAAAAASSTTISTVVSPSTSTVPDSSITDTDTSSLAYTTATYFYCTTPTYSAIGPFVTVFNTVFQDVCPTGITQVTYTITDTCGCQHSTDYTRPTGCPSGFTTTEKTCTACPGSPIITCTTPMEPVIEPSNHVTGTAFNTHGPNGQSSPNPSQSYVQQPGSTPSSAIGTHPTYETTNSAKPAAGSSPLGVIMVTSMFVVAGLMCIL